MKRFFAIKYIAILVNVFIVINTLGLIILGIYRTYHACRELLHLDQLGKIGYNPGLEFLEALDVFLAVLVFMVLIIGINSLFIRHDDKDYLEMIPEWMRVKSFTELKILLIEAILVTAFVFFISAFVKNINDLSWEFMTVPGSILLIALSLKFIRGKH